MGLPVHQVEVIQVARKPDMERLATARETGISQQHISAIVLEMIPTLLQYVCLEIPPHTTAGLAT